MNSNNNIIEHKQVKFSKESFENENQNKSRIFKSKLITANLKKSLREEEPNDEILLNKKRNFSKNIICSKHFANQNQTSSGDNYVNYLDYSEFKKSEKIYSCSNNKSSRSTIKKINDYVIKETQSPENTQKDELDQGRLRGSNYKFTSEKKFITNTENHTGIKAFANNYDVIENNQLDKLFIPDITVRPESKYLIMLSFIIFFLFYLKIFSINTPKKSFII